MRRAPDPHGIDVCRVCHLVWFDAGELEAAPRVPVSGEPSEKERRARVEAERILLPRRLESIERQHDEDDAPETLPRWIAVLMGLPVEASATTASQRPIATWTVAAAIVLAFLGTAAALDRAIESWGFVPVDPFRHAGMTMATSFFLHGGLYHLATNLYFLLVFGDDVESDVGPLGFLLLLAGSDLASNLAYPFLNLGSEVPLVGASGGISGVLGYYAVRFPFRRLYWAPSLWLLVGARGRPFAIPAIVLLALWLLVQGIGLVAELGGMGDVAHLAHLSGCVVGAGWAILRGPSHR
jgi:membrane associated rhomboid family serine protease